jgi:hypothetical protein
MIFLFDSFISDEAIIVLKSTKTTLIVVALMAALSIAAISTFVDTALAAKPTGTPGPGTGPVVSGCARSTPGPGCSPGFTGP